MLENFVTPDYLLRDGVELCELIQFACIKGNLEIIHSLVKAGIDINVPDVVVPPVVMALAASRPGVAAALIAMGAEAIDPLESGSGDLFRSEALPKQGDGLKEPPFRVRRVCERGVLCDRDDFTRSLSRTIIVNPTLGGLADQV